MPFYDATPMPRAPKIIPINRRFFFKDRSDVSSNPRLSGKIETAAKVFPWGHRPTSFNDKEEADRPATAAHPAPLRLNKILTSFPSPYQKTVQPEKYSRLSGKHLIDVKPTPMVHRRVPQGSGSGVGGCGSKEDVP
jgi:hypothetical protein